MTEMNANRKTLLALAQFSTYEDVDEFVRWPAVVVALLCHLTIGYPEAETSTNHARKRPHVPRAHDVLPRRVASPRLS